MISFPSKLLTGVVAAGSLWFATGCSLSSHAKSPSLNILAAEKVPATLQVDTSAIPETEYCSEQSGLKDFCVTHFRSAITKGLNDVFSVHFAPAEAPTYQARFKLVEFSHSLTSVTRHTVTVKVTMKWQFEILDDKGKPIVQVAEMTDGPQQLAFIDAADTAISALLGVVLEKISGAIKATTWPKPVEAPPQAPPESVADPAATTSPTPAASLPTALPGPAAAQPAPAAAQPAPPAPAK